MNKPNINGFNALAGKLASDTKYKGSKGVAAILSKARSMDKQSNCHHYLVAAASSLLSGERWISGRMPIEIMPEFNINAFNRCVETAEKAYSNK